MLYGGREGLFQFSNVASITTKTADGVVSATYEQPFLSPGCLECNSSVGVLLGSVLILALRTSLEMLPLTLLRPSAG